MNQQKNAISLARVSAISLVGKSQAWNLVKHRIGWKLSSLIVLCFVSESISCESISSTSKINSQNRHTAEFIYITKQYNLNGLHYTLSIIDSANRYLSVFSNKRKAIPINHRAAERLVLPRSIVYTLKRKKVLVQVVDLGIMRSCYDKFNTFDGWIGIRNSRKLVKIDSLGKMIQQIDTEIGKSASVVTAPFNGFMCEDVDDQEVLDCSAYYIRAMEEIEKFKPKQGSE